MPRNMSFALTTPQMRDRSKTVTRRTGWRFLKEGEIVCAVEKGQGLKRGEKVVRIGLIRILDVRPERLDVMLDRGRTECAAEGFPGRSPASFVAMFCRTHKGCGPGTVVTRIEFEHIDGPPSVGDGLKQRAAAMETRPEAAP